MTLTAEIIETVVIYPGRTATRISHRMDRRDKLAIISSILNKLCEKKRLYRAKSFNGSWTYFSYDVSLVAKPNLKVMNNERS